MIAGHGVRFHSLLPPHAILSLSTFHASVEVVVMWKRCTFVLIFAIYLAIVLFLALSSVDSTQAQPSQPNRPCSVDAQHFDYHCLVSP